MTHYTINLNIKKAHTLPGSFYKDVNTFELVKEKIMIRSWHLVANEYDLSENNYCYPFTLLPNCLDEPLLLSRNSTGDIACMSNVCTHRGFVMIKEAGKRNVIRCAYHGRCFNLAGKFKSMPEFENAEHFPTKDDDLPHLPLAKFGKMLFTSLNPKVNFEEVIAPISERLSFLPLENLRFDAYSSCDYFIDANWALYCDNYLEGFHVPFVHPALNKALDYGNYTTHIYPYCNLQLAIAKKDQACFELPPESPDYGKRVFAYYYFVFPNMMLNFYPWGISVNLIKPMGIDKTKIEFRTFLYPQYDASVVGSSHIHITELEDEAVVEAVQKGVQSRLYKRGRFSPTQEKGVHHFHSLIAQWLNE